MKRLIFTLAIGFALQATTSYAQFDPHPEGIDYTENFRGQFHFSPKTEWMNDVNALMYHDGKMRITRTPIPGIKTIYKGTKTWRDKTIKEAVSGTNVFDGAESKTFDLTAEFDLSGATAKEFEFKIANKVINYNIEQQTLLGKSLKPHANGRLTIRKLVDWGQLEIFSAGGVFSYSQQFAFTPDDASLNLYTKGGEVRLVSLQLNEVARTWP